MPRALHSTILKIAAYECARVGIIPGTTLSDMQLQCDAVLAGRRIKNYRLTTIPADPRSLHFGDVLTATVTATTKDNALAVTWFYRTETWTESVKIMAENNEP